MKILVSLFSILSLCAPAAHAEGYGLIFSGPQSNKKGDILKLRLPSNKLRYGYGANNDLFAPQTSCEAGMSFSANKPSPAFEDLVDGGLSIHKFLACSSSSELGSLFDVSRFGSTSCTRAIACQKTLTEDKVDKDVKSLLNQIVAKDYGINVFNQNLEAMEEVEELRRFADESFGVKAEKCSSRFSNRLNKDACQINLLEETFTNYQENCVGGVGCFNAQSDDISVSYKAFTEKYKVFKEKRANANYKSNVVSDFFFWRTNTNVAKKLTEDKAYITRISELVASSNFQKANADQKMEMFLSGIGIDSLDRIKDPALKLDFGSTLDRKALQKSEKFKELAALYSKKNITADEFATAFNGYRKKRTQETLEKGSLCKDTKSLQFVCYEMTGLAEGKTIAKDAINAEHVSSKKIGSSPDLEKLKKLFSKDITQDQFEVLINAKRCSAFEIGSDLYSTTTSDSSIPLSPGGRLAAAKPSDWSKDVSGDYNEDSRNIISFMGSTGLESSSHASSGAVKEFTSTGDEIQDFQTTGNISEQFTSAFGDQSQINNNSSSFSDMYNSSQFANYGDHKVEEVPEVKKEEESSSSSVADTKGSSSAMNDKVNDLMKKLAAAEERVDKMKADSEAAEADRAKQKKMDEENALIKELKGQISDLKSQQNKKEAVAVAAPAKVDDVLRTPGSGSTTLYSSGASSSRGESSSSSSKGVAAESYDSGRAAGGGQAGGGGSSSSTSRSVASLGAVLTSTSNDSRTTTLASGLVITTIDGLSAEKASQTIYSKILEMKEGENFFIEEGGFVKQIVPVRKNGEILLDDKGNPIYEKVVKGKVGEKKYAKKERVPASITDSADLKRDQEEKLKRERAEYLKLKNITSGAINKK